jgi:hypothetical protein
VERLLVRFGTFGVISASVVLAAVMHTPERLPATAFGWALLLFFERLLVVATALLFLLVVAYRGWRGDLPTRLSDRGAEWEPIVREGDATRANLDSIRARLASVETELNVLDKRLEGVEWRE